MATKEPYVSSSVYDMTGGLLPAPADDGYNIAMWVNTPAGPTTKTKVLSQKDFIDKYMIGTSITPNDHMSAIMAYMTLAQNPVYVLRACPVSFLEGISCTGNSYLFDKNYHILDNYYRFKISDIAVPTGEFKIGTDLETSSIDEAQAPNAINTLVNSIMPTLENSSDADYSAAVAMKPISAKNYNIIAKEQLKFSDNLAYNEVVQYGEYSQISMDSSGSSDLEDGAALNVGNTTAYYLGTGNNTGTYANGVAIHYGKNSETIEPRLFLHLVAKATGVIENTTDAKLVLYDNSTEASLSGNGLTSLDVINYGSKPELLKADRYTVASSFANKDIAIADSNPVYDEQGEVPVHHVPEEETIWNDNGTLKFYLPQSESPDYTVNALNLMKVTVGSEVINYLFVADAVSSSGIVAQQIFCLTITDTTTCKQTSALCKDYDDLLDFFINRWCGIKSSFDIRMDGKITLWSKAVSPFASYNEVLSSAISTDDDSQLTYHYSVASDAENANVLKHDFLWIQVNDILYYSGNMPQDFVITASTQVQLSPKAITSVEFKQLLEGALYLNQKIGEVKHYYVSTSEMTVAAANNITFTEPESVDQTGHTEQFAIVQAFPTTEAMFQYSYELDEDSVDASGSIYNLHLNYKGGEVRENWTISFNPGKVDGYGVDQWYNRVQSDYFKIVSFTEEGVLGDIQDSFSSQTWGSGVSVPEYNVQYAIDAMQSLPQYEDGVHYHVLSDAGVANTTLASAIEALADQMHSVYLASVPEAELNINALKAYVGGADLKSYQTRILAAGDRININGFSKILPGSYKLILQYISMFRNKGQEFAPNFGLSHGVVGVSNLVQDFNKAEREELLDSHIECLKGGVVTEYYINRNDTMQKIKSYMSEDQNVRMTNIAVHLCEDNLKQYIGELNTAVLRDLVQTRLTTAIQDRLFKGKQYAPAMYRVVCDDSNNPLSVIEQNQLVVSLYASFTPSIQYVLVDHFIVPLSQVQ